VAWDAPVKRYMCLQRAYRFGRVSPSPTNATWSLLAAPRRGGVVEEESSEHDTPLAMTRGEFGFTWDRYVIDDDFYVWGVRELIFIIWVYFSLFHFVGLNSGFVIFVALCLYSLALWIYLLYNAIQVVPFGSNIFIIC